MAVLGRSWRKIWSCQIVEWQIAMLIPLSTIQLLATDAYAHSDKVFTLGRSTRAGGTLE
jgi:hypothetical protein